MTTQKIEEENLGFRGFNWGEILPNVPNGNYLRHYQGGNSGWGYYHHVFMIKENNKIKFQVHIDLEWYRDQEYQDNGLTFEEAKKIEVAPFKTFENFDLLSEYIVNHENEFRQITPDEVVLKIRNDLALLI